MDKYVHTLTASELIASIQKLASNSKLGLDTPVLVSNETDYYLHAIGVGELTSNYASDDYNVSGCIELNMEKQYYDGEYHDGVQTSAGIVK
jgi:hypothetical protein